MMAEYKKVARLADIPEQSCAAVEVDGHRIGLFNLQGEIFAIDDRCTHAEASLCDGGMIQGDEVVCPLHMATFDIKTGACTGPPADEDLRSYPVRIVSDEIEIEV
jgi:nitrite reductase/ring-hydroxylating ferredoxin subunit